MIVYRFTPVQYRNDISGEGSRIYGGRWNSIGLPVVYTSTTISLSLLEILVYSASYDQLQNNTLVRIEVPDTASSMIPGNALSAKWNDPDYTRYIGDEFLIQKKSLLLRVPSAIVPEEYNILINPLHPDFKKVKISSAKKFEFDGRLFK